MGIKLITLQHNNNTKEFQELTKIANFEFMAWVETNKKTKLNSARLKASKFYCLQNGFLPCP